MKYIDIYITGGLSNSVGTVGYLNTIPQDVTQSGRIGRKVNITSFQFKGFVQAGNSTTNLFARIRFIIFCDEQTGGAITPDPIAQVTLLAYGGDAQHACNSPRNLANVDRYKIYYDQTYCLNYQNYYASSLQNNQVNRNISIYKKLNLPVEFDNSVATGVITSCRSNSLQYMIVADTTTTATSSVNGYFRIRYSDL